MRPAAPGATRAVRSVSSMPRNGFNTDQAVGCRQAAHCARPGQASAGIDELAEHSIVGAHRAEPRRRPGSPSTTQYFRPAIVVAAVVLGGVADTASSSAKPVRARSTVGCTWIDSALSAASSFSMKPAAEALASLMSEHANRICRYQLIQPRLVGVLMPAGRFVRMCAEPQFRCGLLVGTDFDSPGIGGDRSPGARRRRCPAPGQQHGRHAARDGGRMRGTDAEVWNRFFHVWTLRDGRIVRLSIHPDRSRSLEAAGLSDSAGPPRSFFFKGVMNPAGLGVYDRPLPPRRLAAAGARLRSAD